MSADKHDWEDFAPFKRRCRRCRKEQWIVENKFPDVGEPKFQWITLHREQTGDCDYSLWSRIVRWWNG
ncbi:MAG: hypothetical protein KGZ68_11005 [Dechloromonas sp.]|nr:hypothetical protein [Dechloromonas sp.]